MTNLGLKVKLIIWKSIRLRWRTKICTAIELLIPISLVVLLALGVGRLNAHYERTFNNPNARVYYPINKNTHKVNALFYTPSNKQTELIMNSVKTAITAPKAPAGQKEIPVDFRGFQTESTMMDYVFNILDPSKYDEPIGVVFYNVPDDKLPTNLHYNIRARGLKLFQVENLFAIIDAEENPECEIYFNSKFILVQQAVDSAFISLHKKSSFTITFQRMPAPSNIDTNNVIKTLFLLYEMLLVIAFIVTVLNLINKILEEKQSGVTELMKMMGLRPWMLWLGWYVYAMIVLVPVVLIIAIISKVELAKNTSSLHPNSNFFLILLLYLIYVTSMVLFVFFSSVFFNSASMGTSVTAGVWLISGMIQQYVPASMVVTRDLLLVFPNSCLFSGLTTIVELEKQGTGLTWSKLFQVAHGYPNEHSVGVLLLILLLECLFYLLVIWYVGRVYPGHYGIRQPWNFCCKKYKNRPADNLKNIPHANLEFHADVEAASAGLEAGIKIINLRKIFGNTVAVNGLDLELYSNQITVLLGHNGAGKTTTMNIICGMLEASSGTVLVNGFDTRTHMDEIRHSLGLCPQHNIHFASLTVIEHLMFFAMLKGLQKNEANAAALELLDTLKMSDKANVTADKLSGGFQRRLSLGMALVGPTSTLMLDEPTSGMDPEARREIWDTLLKMRGHRTILISTHYMDEADVLGDRIAIMYGGELLCYGSTMFLKKRYGSGYTLSVLITPKADLNAILNSVRSLVSNASIIYVSGVSVKIELPTSNTAKLSELFFNLESYKNTLGITNFGVSLTTIDDVFLQVERIANKSSNDPKANSALPRPSEGVQYQYNTGNALLLQQCCALLAKRVQYYKYKKLVFLAALLLPIVIHFLILILAFVMPSTLPSKILKLDAYPSAVSYYSVASGNEGLASYYEIAVRQQQGTPNKTNQVSEAILNSYRDNPGESQKILITAAEFNSSSFNAMYGCAALHSPAISLNLITSALLKQALGNAEASITTTNCPLTKPEEEMSGKSIASQMIGAAFVGTVTISMCIILIFHVNERSTGVKHLQIMYGVPRCVYWTINYIFDMFIYLFIITVCVILLLVFRHELSHSSVLGPLTLLLLLFCMATLTLTYFFHYCQTAAQAQKFLLILTFVFAITFPFILELWNQMQWGRQDIRETLVSICKTVPPYGFMDGLNILLMQALYLKYWETGNQTTICHDVAAPCCVPDSQECKEMYNMLTGDKIYKHVLYLLAAIAILFVIFLLIDYGYVRRFFDSVVNTAERSNEKLDSDVVDEQNRVDAAIEDRKRIPASGPSHLANTDVLLVSNLRRSFCGFAAVRGIYFGVKPSECFGLLGTNGAGKTTTFKMLVGDIFPTKGTTNIFGHSLTKNKGAYLKHIGYCPQFDALNFQLTVGQLVALFSHIRGIPTNKTDSTVDMWLGKFDIMKYKHIQAEKLSGGNKRKVSTIIALVGEPAIVMLDEPTSGVDPVARRKLWSILATVRSSGQAIVLTSHSMDECEALCDRLVIMVDGQMRCIGNIQYIKSKFGKGFTVEVKLKYVTTSRTSIKDKDIAFEKQVTDLKETIEKKFECVLKDEHKGMLMYHIEDSKVTLGKIFGFMDYLKQSKEIVEDFVVRDTSLEEVFLSFAEAKDRRRHQKKIKKRSKTQIV